MGEEWYLWSGRVRRKEGREGGIRVGIQAVHLVPVDFKGETVKSSGMVSDSPGKAGSRRGSGMAWVGRSVGSNRENRG